MKDCISFMQEGVPQVHLRLPNFMTQNHLVITMLVVGAARVTTCVCVCGSVLVSVCEGGVWV